MATKSFIKNVTLRGKRECQSFIRALERSDDSPTRSYPIDEQVSVHDMDKEAIRKLFKVVNENDRVLAGELEGHD